MPLDQRKIIGQDIKTLQLGWPVGMPLARQMERGLWELRSSLLNRTARIFFTVHTNHIVLLHGFVKKTQKTPPRELALEKQRMTKLRSR